MKQAEINCSRLKSRVATERVTRKNSQLMRTMKVRPVAKPKNGDNTIASKTERKPVSFTVSQPPCVTAAPTIPPMSACEELVGKRSSHHVLRDAGRIHDA